MKNTRKILLTGTIAGLVLALYNFYGNTSDVHMHSRSIFIWMLHKWNYSQGAFTHCYLVPFISIGIIFWRRRSLQQAPRATSPRALPVIVFALLLHLLGIKTQLPRLSLFSLILLSWSIPWYLCGRETARLLLFPCAYLLFCIPLNFLESLTFPLRLISARAAVFLLNGIGIESIRRGTAILSARPGGFQLDVADPCSGLRYFLALTALTALYAYLTQKGILKKWILFIAAIPIAILANIVRILVIGIFARFSGQEAATGVYHDYSGYIVFISAVMIMTGFGAMLKINLRETLKQWKSSRKNLT